MIVNHTVRIRNQKEGDDEKHKRSCISISDSNFFVEDIRRLLKQHLLEVIALQGSEPLAAML